jgi:hypothetical protein
MSNCVNEKEEWKERKKELGEPLFVEKRKCGD